MYKCTTANIKLTHLLFDLFRRASRILDKKVLRTESNREVSKHYTKWFREPIYLPF